MKIPERNQPFWWTDEKAPPQSAVDEARAYVKAHEGSVDPVVNMMRRLLARFDYVVEKWKEEEQAWYAETRGE